MRIYILVVQAIIFGGDGGGGGGDESSYDALPSLLFVSQQYI